MPAIPSSSVNVGALVASLGLDTAAFQAGLAGANTKMKAFSTQMASVGTKMAAIGKKMTMGLTLPIIALGVASIKSQKDFEASMSKIIGLVGVATSQVKEWEKAILKLGPAVGKGPEELADAMFFIASAGIRGSRALEVLEMSAKASASGLGETKLVADLVTSAMNAYGAANLNAAMATDILVATVREGKAEATELAGAMGMVLPIASEMGVTFDQVGAAFAGMTRTGTNARVAATQLKAILSKLMNPTQMAEQALVGMGTSSSELRKSIKEDGLISTLEKLRKTTNKYGEEAMSKVFPNIRALMGVLDLMGKNMEENIAISERMSDSTGSLEAAFEAASVTTQFKFDKAVAQIKTTFTKFGMVMKDFIIPIVEKLTNKISDITERFENLDQTQKGNVIRILAMTAAVGPLLIVFGKLIKLIAANPYVALAAAIALIVMGIVKWVKASKEQEQALIGIERAQKKANVIYNEQEIQIARLVRLADDEALSMETRRKALTKLNQLMPDYNGYLEDETGHLVANNVAIETYLQKLKEKIRLKAFEEEYAKLIHDQAVAQDELTTAEEKYSDAQAAYKGKETIDKKEVTTIYTDGRAPTTTYAPGPLEKAAFATELAWKSAGTALIDVDTALTNLENKAKSFDLDLGLGLRPGGPGGGGGGGGGGGLTEVTPDTFVDVGKGGMLEDFMAYIQKMEEKQRSIFNDTQRAKIASMQDGAGKMKAIEEQRYAETIQNLEQQKIEYPAFAAEINAQIEEEEKAHAARIEAINAASDAKIRAGKLKSAQQWIQNVANAITAISTLIEAQKQRELSAAGDNEEKREEIEKKFFKKQKAMSIASAIINGALAITNMIANVPGSVINPATWVGIGIAVASTAAQVAVIASQSFAEGGIAYGPTMGLVGEYPGARSNPEVIAPLNKLQGLLGGSGSGSGKWETAEVRIGFDEMEIMLEKIEKRKAYR